MAINTNNFTALTSVTIANLGGAAGIHKIDPTTHQPTGDTLTGVTQLTSTSDSWGNFVETPSVPTADTYNVFFFFSASSIDYNSSTYEDVHVLGQSDIFTGATMDSTIYRINDGTEDTDFYAIKMSFKERYESEAGNAKYVSKIHLVTNDPDTFLETTLQVSHTYCKQSASA